MLELGFAVLLAAITSALGGAFRTAAVRAGMSNKKANWVLLRYWIFIILWLVYLSVMVKVGSFKELKSPPSIFLFIILPAFIVIILFNVLKSCRPLINGFPVELTVYLQTFRIFVELLILGVYLKGLGPIETTFEGRNFDILAGASAPIIGWLAYSRKAISRKGIIIWNIACLLLLVNIVMIFNLLIMKPQVFGYDSSPIHPDFATVPYLYIAGVFMPIAVFLHVLSIRKNRT